MELKNLHFFDKEGYEMNFSFNDERNCWEGNVFLSPVSLGLYSSTTIFVLEEVEIPIDYGTYEKRLKTDETESVFVFPRQTSNGGSSVTFMWDPLNAYVDEFFMFTFDSSYVPSKQSALTYSYNNGPECETLLVNRFETYEVPLDDDSVDPSERASRRALPIHVAFSSPAKYDENTYKRTLIMSYDGVEIARITYFAESIEEDERLRIWNYNLGYNISDDDTIIFKNSDIEEPNPNYVLLNEKRKELLIEGHNIYPFVGSYKGLLGAIKFFGYNNLNLVEFWKCIDPDDDNFGQFVMSPKYVLSNQDVTFVKDSTIEFPNSSYRKGNKLAFTYTINTPTEDVDLYELPYTKEEFDYTISEVLIKLYALKKKLNKEFMPSTSKIIDIIGEGSYFGIQLIKNNFSYSTIEQEREPIKLSISCYPDNRIKISEDNYFNNYILENKSTGHVEDVSILNNMKDMSLQNLNPDEPLVKTFDVNSLNLSESEKCELYKSYHKELTHTFTKSEDVVDNDLYKVKCCVPHDIISLSDDDYVTKLGTDISAKIVLTNSTFKDITFNDLPYPFKYIGTQFNQINTLTDFIYDWESVTYNSDTSQHKIYLKWTVSFAENQIDEDYHDNARRKYYESLQERYEYTGNPMLNNEYKCRWDWTPRIEGEYNNFVKPTTRRKQFKAIKYGEISEMNSVLFELPYVGYYDVNLTIYKEVTSHNTGVDRTGVETIIYDSKDFKKYIKVEPHNLDIRGFYYDSRDYNVDNEGIDEIEEGILKTLNYYTYLAQHDTDKLKYKHKGFGGYDLQMVLDPKRNLVDENKFFYKINDGPFARQNFKFGDYLIQDGEFIIDNIDKDVVRLIPTLKTTKYIRNGVDVRPYTWIYLTFDYSKIVHRCNPLWTLKNNTTGKVTRYIGKYFTCLLRDEGEYTVSLKMCDEFGNEYSVDRNIIVVDKMSNHKLYTPFMKEYRTYKEYEDWKSEIQMAALMDNGIDETDDGDYMFSFNSLNEYDYDEFIHCLNREKPQHTRPVEDITGRLTIKPGYGIGWGYEVPFEIGHFDTLNIELEYDIPSDDNLVLIIAQTPEKYSEHRITSKSTEIKVSDIKGIDLSNISYIIFFNMNDVNSDNRVEINLINNIYFSYNL